MNKRYLYPKDWNILRVKILIRDKFCCTICGIEEVKILSYKGTHRSLHVMHIDGNTKNNKYVLEGELFNNPDNNLASGCPECHKLFDRIHNSPPVYRKKENHVMLDMSLSKIN